MIKLPLAFRIYLFRLGYQVKELNLEEVPLFTPIDLMLVPKIGWKKAVWLLTFFYIYRRNLEKSNWHGVTSFYPRVIYILYYYLLFWWADYCGVLREVINKPEGSLVAESFLYYIIEIDRLIDAPGNQYLVEDQAALKFHQPTKKLLENFLEQIRSSPLPLKDKKRLCHQIWLYRRLSLESFKNKKPYAETNIKSVVENKVITVGGLFQNWAALLSELYCSDKSPELVDSSIEIIRLAGMAMQVLDDTLDWPIDFGVATENIFNEYLRENPNEMKLAQNYYHNICNSHLDGFWMEKNLPVTYTATKKLLNGYFSKIKRISMKPIATDELCKILGTAQDHTIGV